MLATVPAAVIASAVATIAGWPSPLEATAEFLMEWTPVGLANLILDHLGSIARPAALLGALAVAMLAGGMAGAVYAAFGHGPIRRCVGAALGALLLAGVFLWLVPPSSRTTDVVFNCALLAVLLLISTSWERRVRTEGASRREFLLRTGTIVGGAAVLVSLFSVRPLLNALGARRLFPFRPARGLPIAGLTDLVTPSGKHYVMDKVLQAPALGPPGWRMPVDGQVAHPISLDYGALLGRGRHSRYVTMECVDNPVGGSLISTALWTGIPVVDLLREVGARGDTVVFHGSDGHAEGVARGELERSGGIIAYAINGEVLPREHGYPVRLILPGHYGFKSVKWLERVEVTHGAYRDEWQAHGWTATAHIHTTTRIDVARRTHGEILVAGLAFSGTRGVRAVEVRVNGGPWRRASLGRVLSEATWVQWAIRLHGEGRAIVEARAIDGHGAVQLSRRQGAYPDGATGWATVTV